MHLMGFNLVWGFFFSVFPSKKIKPTLLYFINSSKAAIIQIYGITVSSSKCFVDRYQIWFLKLKVHIFFFL